MKILILKPSSLGDVIQALPVLRLLKQHYPESEIHWWIASGLADLLRDDPDLSGIIPFDRRAWSSWPRFRAAWQTLRGVRHQQFDWVLDLQALARSALYGWAAAGRFFVGLDDLREGASALYDLCVPRPGPRVHAVEWYLEVLRRLNVPVHRNFVWLPERPDIRGRIEERWPLGESGWIALQPGARWLNKRWPAGHFRELVRRWEAGGRGERFVILGGPDDRSAGDEIASAAPDRCVNLSGKTSLGEMVEWIRRSRAIVTNDTGPMHAAAALGIPVIGVFGPTDPLRTGPYGQSGQVLRLSLPCIPCMKSTCYWKEPLACLTGIDPQTVERALRLRLSGHEGG